MKNKKYYNKKIWNRIKLILSMSVLVFSLICISLVGLFTTYFIVNEVPFLDIEKLPAHSQLYIFAAISLVIGVVLAFIFRKIIVIPLHNSYMALGKVADGDYNVVVKEDGIRAVRNVAQSINKMTTELDSVEIMRNDFINSFSHEFKTPIVSISGFAKILKDRILTAEEREEYLNIIISEAERLSLLSTNVLNLTKLDSQTILTDVTKFNVTEQIRLTVVLLEYKWSEKNILVNLEGDEHIISGNENILQQVWINLLDNAIKYSPENSEITIAVESKGKNLIITFADSGKGMSEEEVKHAFERFYQGDIGHKSRGYGIGLHVAKRICELHEGDVRIRSTGKDGTVFEVVLPIDNE